MATFTYFNNTRLRDPSEFGVHIVADMEALFSEMANTEHAVLRTGRKIDTSSPNGFCGASILTGMLTSAVSMHCVSTFTRVKHTVRRGLRDH
jgi:hypothetical protein